MAPPRSWLAVPLIAALVGGLYAASTGFVLVLGLPWDLGIPVLLRLLGWPLLAAGLGFMAWVFRFRGPRAVLDSTFLTLLKLLGRLPVSVPAGRTEPLVVAGPYRVVRHPLYSGVIALTFGIALVVDHTFAWVGAVGLFLWLGFVLAPFEERELLALFGDAYAAYMGTRRRFLPLPRRRG